MDVTGSALYETTSTGYRNKHFSNADAFANNRLRLDAAGRLISVFSEDAGYTLGIRPLNANSARPGDDLLLSFGLRTCGSSGALSFTGPEGTAVKAHKTLDESDYLAVYDKKLLWRANLYIAEPGGRDWNDVHPWNAPPDTATAAAWYTTRTMPAWWSAEWGYNEWNRKYDKAEVFASMNNLSAGDGKQVISAIPDSKWFYQMADGNPEFLLNNRVSYDHQGWDDPFSFKNKMLNQKKFLNQYYAANGDQFRKPVYVWKAGVYSGDPDEWNINNIAKIERLKECLPESHDDIIDLDELIKAFKAFRDNENRRWNNILPPAANAPLYKNYIHPSDYGTDASPYSTAANNPNQEWVADVIKAASDAMTIGSTTYYPYVPGLSDSIMTSNSYPPAAIGRKTAGVDCIGFVQRTYGYSGENYGAINADSHKRAPIYWTGGDIPVSAMSNFTGNTDWESRVVGKNNSMAILKLTQSASQN